MKKTLFFLLLILLIALFTRIYRISLVPPSLSWDEAAIGYDAYSVVETGKDQWGVSWPVAFKSFGEYKYPLHIYAAGIFIKLFGLSEFSVRIGSVIFGVINVLLLYLFVKTAFKKKKLALLSSFFLAISPWHIQFSRVSWETNYALFFFLLGLIFFFKYINEKPYKRYIVFSFLSFGITLFTYNAAKIFVPIIVITLIILYFQKLIKQKIFYISIVIFLVFIGINFLNPNLSGLNRLSQLSLMEYQVVETYAYKTTKVYKLGVLEVYAKQYLSHFSAQFLFMKGDPNPRHSIQTVGELYWFDVLLLPIGLIFLVKKRNKIAILLLIWFFTSIIPASITRETPHASRAMFALGGWQIISAMGLISIFSFKGLKNRLIFKSLFIFIIFLFFLNYLRNYFGQYPKTYSQYWQYGYRQVASYINVNYDKYDKIYITRKYGEPQIFLLFYLKYPPEKYQNDANLIRRKEGDWIKVFAFDKFVFLEDSEVKDIYNSMGKTKEKVLFIGTAGNFPNSVISLEVINFLDGSPAFQIVEI